MRSCQYPRRSPKKHSSKHSQLSAHTGLCRELDISCDVYSTSAVAIEDFFTHMTKYLSLICSTSGLQPCHINLVQSNLWQGHFGNNINSAVVSFVERLSFSRRFKMYWIYRETNYSGPWKVSFVERSNILCPYLRGSTIGGFTIHAGSVCLVHCHETTCVCTQ